MSYRDHQQYESFFLEWCRRELAGEKPVVEHRVLGGSDISWQIITDITPAMAPYCEYRFAQKLQPKKKIRIGNREINPPLNEGLKDGQQYWVVLHTGQIGRSFWRKDEVDQIRLIIGNCWETEEDAHAYADAARDQRLGRL